MRVESSGGTVAAVGKTLPLKVLQAVVLYWFLLKIGAVFVGEPHADEAYYWMWGQHPALSYLDHPPFHAWLLSLVSMVLGWNLAALRILSVVTSAATLWIFYTWAKRLRPDDWKPTFWLTAALFYSSPMLMLYTTVALHDRVLVLLALGSIHFFVWFFADWVEGKRSYRWLYLAAVLLGLATLSKYTGALVGLGVLAAILVRRDLRGLLRDPQVYLAALLSVAIQVPVIYWNLTEGFASAQFHFASGGFEGVNTGLAHLYRVVLETLPLLSPFAIVPIGRFVATRAGTGFGGLLHSTAKWVFVASTVTILAVTFVYQALFYWNIIAYAAAFGAGAWAFRSRINQALHIGWGVLLTTILFVHFSIVPFLGSPDAQGIYGWQTIAERVRQAEVEQHADFAGAAQWLHASQLGFAMKDKDVASIHQNLDGYDYWFDEDGHAGKTAIVVMEPNEPRYGYVASRFKSLEKIGEVPIERFGIPVRTYELYVGRGYIPDHQATRP